MSEEEVVFDDEVEMDEGVDNYDEELVEQELQAAELDAFAPDALLAIMCKYRDGTVLVRPIGPGVLMSQVNPRHKGLTPTKVYIPEGLRERLGINVFLRNCAGAEIVYGDTGQK